MKYKKIMIILITAVFLVSIAGVCASDVNDTAVASEDSLEIDQTDDAIGVGEDTNLASSEENEVLSADEQTFTQLNATINANNEKNIYLNGNYKYSSGDDSFKDGVVISREVNIYGNGATIDGNSEARIFQVNGGNAVFYNITFVNGNAGDGWEDNGGAIYGYCRAINCTFKENHAGYGGAMFGGSAVNCTFSGNTADVQGGAMVGGSAVNCTFSGNTAGVRGGAIEVSHAVNCTFSGNTAEYGGAISVGYKLNCIGQDPNDYYKTEDLLLHWDADNFTIAHGSVKKLPIGLRDQDDFSIDSINYDVVIYKDGSKFRTYHCLGYEELSVDLDVGVYTAELTVTYPGINQPEPKNITLTIVKTDGTTFSDLNSLINNNTNDTITLDKDYAFNSTVDSYFTEGIAINRPLAINGNGHTIDAKGKAGVFNVAAGDVTINNMTIKNGRYRDGGAIYFIRSGTVKNCNFTGNEGSFGGAIYFDEAGNVENCNFDNNKATYDAGAVYFAGQGTVLNCNFTDNRADFSGGAVYFIRQGTVSNCNFSDNQATSNGGAVLFNKQGTTLNCNFADNKATYGGAVVYFGGQGIALNCNFTDNLADVSGGAIYFYSLGNATNCNFVNDTAYERGGAIMATNGGSVENCNFTDCHTSNEKDSSKAAIYDDGGNLIVDNCNYVDTPIATVIVSSPVTTVYNVNKNLVITLKDSQGRPLDGVSVSVNINGNKVYTTDRNGQIKINVAKLVPKTYTAKITFNGNSKYEASSASVKVTVKKAKAKMVAKKKTFKRKVKVKKYTITLKDNVGKAIKNAKVTIKIKKKTYRAKTNAKGKAVFKIKKLTKKGKYTALVKFNGDKFYSKVTKKVKITVK